jgi:SNF2-related domain/Helicase conserved C-terminal domain
MRVKGVSQRLDFSTRRLSRAQWRLLGAIAVERELARSLVVKLGGTFGVLEAARPRASAAGASVARGRVESAVLERSAKEALPVLDEWYASGLLVEVGEARGAGFARGSSEPTLAVNAEFRELVVRRLAGDGDLSAVVEATRTLLGDRSFGVFALLLQTGELAEFQRHAYLVSRAASRLLVPIESDELVRDAITRPFDPEWFVATFRGQALATAQKVLRDALTALDECDELLTWSASALEGTAADGSIDGDERSNASASLSAASLGHTLAEHAVLRGRLELAEARAAALPPALRWPIEAATHFLSADLGSARRLLDAWQESKGPAPEAGAISPLLALISYGRGTPTAAAESKRLMASRYSDAGKADPAKPDAGKGGVERAFRTFFKYGAQPESEHARLDVHQLSRGAGAWELFVFGLTVHLYLKQDVTRAAWAVRLVRAGADWIEAGYSWIGRQALFLARALSAEYFQREFEAVKGRLFFEGLDARPGELILSELILAKPDWERALEALAELAEQPTEEVDTSRRIAWFVSMVDGSIERPSLQELKRGGWSKGRRLTLPQLWPLASELPREDQDVLANTRELGPDKREFLPEAIEALVNHPRVFNGARGGQRVDVVRGTARVETRDERGFLSIFVEPRGARLGVNVVIDGEARLVVYRVTPAMQRVIELLPEGLRIPKERESEALGVLGKLSRGVEVQSRHLGADRGVEANATPCLRITPEAGSWLVQIGVRPFGDQGRFFTAGAGKATLSLYAGGERLICTRDMRLEKASVSSLLQSTPTLLERCLDLDARAPGEGRESWDFDEAGLLDLLVELSEGGEPHALEWPESAALRMRGRATGKSLHGSLRRKKGWYLATGGLKLDDGTEIAIAELTQGSFVAGGRFVRLPNGDYVGVEERIRQVMAALANAEPISPKSGELRIHQGALSTLGTLSELSSDGGGFALDTEAEAWLVKVATLEHQEFSVPSTVSAELRSYQLEGFRWLSRLAALGLGACLADDMGLGKTIQVLALIAGRLEEGPTLVVAPTSVCANWMSEAARFAPSLRVAEYAGSERGELLAALGKTPPEALAPQIVVCSYGLLQQDQGALETIEWGTLVLDEAQFIKNAESQRARAASRLRARCRIAATGTPVENHLGDLWSIFNFINPGLLGPWRSFNHRYLKPIEVRGEDAVRQGLQEQIKPFILRRTKAEVLADLPPLTIVDHSVQLSESEARGYALLRRQIHEKLYTTHGKRENKIEILAEITRLRRYCCHPRLVFPQADSEASKLQAMLDLVLELRENQHRALVFSQYVDFLELVRQRLDEAEVTYQYLDGSTPRAQRAARVNAFQAGEGTLFLISLKAGGFGLNLTAADYVIHLDPWWNPAVEAQATDRAHRIGQDRPVTVYRLITKDTIEESIVALHKNKRALAEALLSEGSDAAALSVGELIGLIEREPPA